MQLPNLPTDNLYKFIAISGLLLIFLSTVLPLWLIHNMELELIETEEERDFISYELEILNNEIKLLEKQEEFLQALSSNTKRDLTKLNNKETKDIGKAEQKTIDIRKELMKSKIKSEKLSYLVSEITKLKLVIFIGNFIGIMFTSYGFSLWYRRLQKYQDEIIKNEARKQLQNNSQKE